MLRFPKPEISWATGGLPWLRIPCVMPTQFLSGPVWQLPDQGHGLLTSICLISLSSRQIRMLQHEAQKLLLDTHVHCKRLASFLTVRTVHDLTCHMQTAGGLQLPSPGLLLGGFRHQELAGSLYFAPEHGPDAACPALVERLTLQLTCCRDCPQPVFQQPHAPCPDCPIDPDASACSIGCSSQAPSS